MSNIHIRIEHARLNLEMASRQYHKPPLGEPAEVSQQRLNQAAIALSKLCDQRDAMLRKSAG